MINVSLVYELDNCSNNPCNDFGIKFADQVQSNYWETHIQNLIYKGYVGNSSLKHAKLRTVIF